MTEEETLRHYLEKIFTISSNWPYKEAPQRLRAVDHLVRLALNRPVAYSAECPECSKNGL